MSLNLDVEHLTAPVHPVLWIHAVRAKGAPIRRIFSELWSDKSIGGAAVGAAALGLFAFRIGHGRKFLVVGAPAKEHMFFR